MVPQLFFADGTGGIDLVTQDEEGNLGEFFNREQCVEFGFRFRETLEISAVDEEDDSVDLGEVVTPESTSWDQIFKLHANGKLLTLHTLLVATKVVCGEFHVANGKLLGCCKATSATGVVEGRTWTD